MEALLFYLHWYLTSYTMVQYLLPTRPISKVIEEITTNANALTITGNLQGIVSTFVTMLNYVQ